MNPAAVFSLGLPAAGKSTLIRARYSKGYTVLDCDKIKEGHPDYNPKNPGPLHAWSKAVLAGLFSQALAAGRPFVLDGTGTNTEKLLQDMTAARRAGFLIRLLYVTVPLPVSLARNAARSRIVPRDVIENKAATIAAAFEKVRPFADQVEIFDNSGAEPRLISQEVLNYEN